MCGAGENNILTVLRHTMYDLKIHNYVTDVLFAFSKITVIEIAFTAKKQSHLLKNRHVKPIIMYDIRFRHKYWKMGNGEYVFETKITTTRARCFKMKLYNSCLSCYLMYKIDVRTFFKRFPHMTVQFEICISLFSGIFFVTLAVFVCGILCIFRKSPI